jgi:hypothetical protein
MERTFLAQASALAFAIAGLVMALCAANGGGPVASTSATIFAGVSLLLTIRAASSEADEFEAALGAMDALVGALDVSSFL